MHFLLPSLHLSLSHTVLVPNGGFKVDFPFACNTEDDWQSEG